MKRFLMLLATSYVPGLLIMLTSGGDDKALVIAAISIVFVPCFTAWAVIVMFCDMTGWDVTARWQIFLVLVAYLQYFTMGIVFLITKKRRVQKVAFVLYSAMVLLSWYGMYYFARHLAG